MARRKRTREYVVVEDRIDILGIVKGGLSDTRDAEKFIKELGTPGIKYRIACLIGGPVTVEVKEIRRAVLTVADKPAAPKSATTKKENSK